MTDMTRSLLEPLVPFARNVSVRSVTRDFMDASSGMAQHVVVGRVVTFELIVPTEAWPEVSGAIIQLGVSREVGHHRTETDRSRTIAEMELTGDTALIFCDLIASDPAGTARPIIVGVDPSASHLSARAREERQREYEEAALF